MTLRAFILGLLGAAVIAAVGFLNDRVWLLTPFVGNHFPIGVFGLLILLMLTVNPLLYLVRPNWRLSAAELSLMLVMLLTACTVPGTGVMRMFMPALASPIQNFGDPGWKKNHLAEYVPPQMLPNDGHYDPKIIDGFLRGQKKGQSLSLGQLPWANWSHMLETWLPLIAAVMAAVVSLSLIVHRQWAYRERLRYPIAEVAKSFITQDGQAIAPLFRNRVFWIGLAIAMGIHLLNGANQWFSGRLISIPLNLDLMSILGKFPKLTQADGFWALLTPKVYFTVVGFGFLLASDVGLSLGLSSLAITAFMLALVSAGINISGSDQTGGPFQFQRFGSYAGIALLLIYMGRRYYWDVLRGALTGMRTGADSTAVWACRVFFVSMAAFVTMMSLLGLPVLVAVLMALAVMVMYVALARMSAESGLIWMQAGWTPVAVLTALCGSLALGPQGLIIIGLLTVVLAIDPRETLMPFLVNGLKVAEDSGIKPGRAGGSASLALVVGLAIAVPVVLWACYNNGYSTTDIWPKTCAWDVFNNASTQIDKLKGGGEFNMAATMDPSQRTHEIWNRWTSFNVDSKLMWWGLAGIAAVMVFSVLRLRFTWWPLHPIMFLVWGTYPMMLFAPSFLLGWLIKVSVNKLGGNQRYRAMMPLMIGLIAGELLAGVFWMVQGGIYYALTGGAPLSRYQLFPY